MQRDPLKQPCRKCGATAWERLERRGFVAERILPFFDLYPWRCAICNKRRNLSLRHDPDLVRRELEQDREHLHRA